jgi:hypothetical protein
VTVGAKLPEILPNRGLINIQSCGDRGSESVPQSNRKNQSVDLQTRNGSPPPKLRF